jgi:hypothetical protein
MTTTLNLVDSIDPDIRSAIDRRADEIAQGASVDSRIAALLALGSIPIALGALAKDAFGQLPADVLDVLQFALLLEHLEADFYTRGVASTNMIALADLPLFTRIRDHEVLHVGELQRLITGKGSTPAARPNFDFTAKGTLPGFNFSVGQYETFKALAQAFEDTGVRAYKGQVGRLLNDKPVLSAALSIHSVEARHAAAVRKLRGFKGWITGSSRSDLPAFTQGIYDGEQNVTQGTATITSFPDAAANGGVDAATEAFDEPLSKAQVTAIITPFLA